MNKSELNRSGLFNFWPLQSSVLLTAGLLSFGVFLLQPSLVCGQTDSANSRQSVVAKHPVETSTNLTDAYRQLARVIEQESRELERLKLVSKGRERVAEARQNAELAEKIDAGLAHLQQIREEKTRLLESLEKLDWTGDSVIESSQPVTKTSVETNSAPAPVSRTNIQPANSIVQSHSSRQSSGHTTVVSQNRLEASVQGKFRLPCGCLGEIHLHLDAAGARFCLHHHHRTGKMTTQTLPEYTGAISANWVRLIVLADGKTTVFRDSGTGRYLIHRK